MAEETLKPYRDAAGERPEAVPEFRLASDPKGRIWRLRDAYCDNPECKGYESWIDLVPADGSEDRLRFRIDFAKARLVMAEEPPEEAKAMMREFSCRDQVRRLLIRRMQFVRATGLVEKGRKALYEPGRTYGFLDFALDKGPWQLVFEHAGEMWHALDFYCVHSDCTCEEGVLGFYRVGRVNARGSFEPQFGVRLEINAGSARPADDEALTGERLAILESLQRELGDWRGELRRRRALVRRIAQHCLDFAHGDLVASAPAPELPAGTPLPRAARNEPCPCGSGRKFKRCCGG